MKPMFSNSGMGHNKITLVDNGEVVTDDKLNAESFNNFFIDAVSSLAIEENRALLDEADDLANPVKRAIKKFSHHPSIIDIKKNVSIGTKFSFAEIDVIEMISEIDNLNEKWIRYNTCSLFLLLVISWINFSKNENFKSRLII